MLSQMHRILFFFFFSRLNKRVTIISRKASIALKKYRHQFSFSSPLRQVFGKLMKVENMRKRKFFLIFIIITSISYFSLNQTQTEWVPLILLFTYNRSFKTRENICQGRQNGGQVVSFQHCPKTCEFSCRLQDFQERSPAAVLFFGEDFYWPFKLTDKNRSSRQQRWIFWSWEAPIYHPEYIRSSLTFNWSVMIINEKNSISYFLFGTFRTMTYRQDSDIVHDYGRYIARNLSHTIRATSRTVDYYLSSNDNRSTFNTNKEFIHRKNRILWFVSNCRARTKRHELAKQLNRSFPIDEYGQCSSSKTNQTAFDYKFYLAFENAYCQDYITEKAFYNALAHGCIPVVLGSTVANYEKLLPPKSFLHVDQYENLTQLANILINISNNVTIYRWYHQWRDNYRLLASPSNYLIDDRFCDLCIKLHDDKTEKIYNDFAQWLNQCK